MRFYRILLLMLVLGLPRLTNAQCGPVINTFPYNEGFETDDGNWQDGGTLSDWEWGAPSKAIINTAGGGNNCWITGGLSKTTYNGGQRSWLRSPCFDLTTLADPRISFKVFWETEQRFDGASFEYSTNGGNTWSTLGTLTSGDICGNANWFNHSPIQYLNNTAGWSGTSKPTSGSCLGGNGSNGWITSVHSIGFLAGQSQVRFRFIFGAGTVCNAYDGFAFDDFVVEETPAVTTDFTFSCSSANTVSFNTDNLECLTGVSWDFGDPASGALNTATTLDPVHVFTSPGEYEVVLTSTFATGAVIVTKKPVNILQVAVSVSSPVLCNGDDNGAAMVTVTPNTGTLSYTWNTVPAQHTAVATNLAAGTYNVEVTAAGACATTASITLAEPDELITDINVIDVMCTSTTGGIAAFTSGGTVPYQYLWSNGSTSNDINNIPAGNYSVVITDANGCTINESMEVKAITNTVNVSLGADVTVCPGTEVSMDPGAYSSYKWQDNSTARVFIATQPGTYTVEVTDVNGCVGTASKKIMHSCSEIYFPNAFSPNGDGLNETFGALGDVTTIIEYRLQVYNRYGEAVFTTTDSTTKWDGRIKGKPHGLETFTWQCVYRQNGLPVQIKGTVTLVR